VTLGDDITASLRDAEALRQRRACQRAAMAEEPAVWLTGDEHQDRAAVAEWVEIGSDWESKGDPDVVNGVCVYENHYVNGPERLVAGWTDLPDGPPDEIKGRKQGVPWVAVRFDKGEVPNRAAYQVLDG